ncbi:BMC domain-containing protein [Myxococcota bacterium]|nr:BMC domain-containing protein [Myxococcota bacterium]
MTTKRVAPTLCALGTKWVRFLSLPPCVATINSPIFAPQTHLTTEPIEPHHHARRKDGASSPSKEGGFHAEESMNTSHRLEEALGLLECASYTAALAASDAMLKAYTIEFLGLEDIGSGTITTKIWGDVEQVQKAIEIGVEMAEQVGEVISLHVIASPHPSLRKYLRKESL